MTGEGPALRVRNFDATYEYNKSRTIQKGLRWVMVPVDFESTKAFRYLLRAEEGLAYWGLFQCLLCFVARSPREHGRKDGLLMDNDGPLSAETVALQIGCAEEFVERGFTALLDAKVGLLERIGVRWSDEGVQLYELDERRTDGEPTVSAPCPDGVRAVSGQRPAGPRPRPPSAHRKGKARKGKERTGTEGSRNGTGPVRERSGMERNGSDPLMTDDRPVTGTAVAPAPSGTAGKGNGTERKGTEGHEDELSADGGGGRRDNGRMVYCQRFLLEVCEAAGLTSAQIDSQRNPVMAVADRLADRADRDAIKTELVQLAADKVAATPRIQRPMAAWQAEVNQRYPIKDGA